MTNIWDLSKATEEVGGDLESLEYWEIRESRNSTTAETMLPMSSILMIPKGEFCIPAVISNTLKIVKTNSDPINEDNVTLVNGRGLLRTCVPIIGSSKIDADVDHTSLLLQVMGLLNFTKDYYLGNHQHILLYNPIPQTENPLNSI